MALGLDERTPLKQKIQEQQHSSFVTERWLAVILIVSAGWAFCGFLIHEWHQFHEVTHDATAMPPVKFVPGAVALEALHGGVHAQSTPQANPRALDTADFFLKCNPSVPETQTISVNKGGDFLKGRNKSPLDGEKCNSEQVSVIRGVLDRLKYNFEAIAPEPYSYPANVLQVLLAMDASAQRDTIAKYEKAAGAMGSLGDLVKFFAWGLPIPEGELFKALGGDDIVDALTRCNILRKCGSAPVYTSTVQFFPVQGTPIIVATDWPVEQATQNNEPLVQVVDPHTMALAHNVPDATGTKALDLGSVGGVMGLIAGSKGAKEVTVIQESARGAQFVKFNAWLNLMTHKVKVRQQPLKQVHELYQNQDNPEFFLVLAHPAGSNQDSDLKATLQLSRMLLAQRGALVMAIENQHCESFAADYNSQFCGSAETGDLMGSVVCRNDQISATEDKNSQESIIYAWRGQKPEKGMELNQQCGQFHTYHLKEFDTSAGPEACRFARSEMSCPIAEEKREATLQGLLDGSR